MQEQSSQPPEHLSETLNGLIARFIQQLDDGESPDPAEFIANHPEHRTEFLQFVSQYLGLTNLAGHTDSPKSRVIANGSYRLDCVLGKGGMGTVYSATKMDDGRQVALKLLNRTSFTSEENQARFLREAAAIRLLSHKNIVPCEDVGYAEGTPYLAMQLIDGVTLSEIVEDCRTRQRNDSVGKDHSETQDLTAQTKTSSVAADCFHRARAGRSHDNTIAEILAEVASALHAAHERKIVHRDVKPSNLMLDRDGRIWLTDFGLASVGDALTQLTNTGDLLGTPAFMSPEQATGLNRVVDHRSDIYSLGATLFTMATLQRPFIGTSQQILQDVREGRIQPPSAIRPDISRKLEAIILKAMARKPASRYDTCEELETDLRHFATGLPVKARLPGPFARATQWMSRHPAIWSAPHFVFQLL